MKCYKELSVEEIIEHLKDQNLDKELIVESIQRCHPLIDRELDQLAINNDYIKEAFSFLRKNPSYLKVKYFPLREEFVSDIDGLNFEIPEEKREEYKSISNDESFCLEINFIKDNNRLISYRLENKTESKKKFLSMALVGNVMALTVAVSASIGFYNQSIQANPAQISQLEATNSGESSFVDLYEEALQEISKTGYKLDNIPSLGNYDLKLLLTLKDDQGAENIEPKTDEILASIQDIISPYIKNEANREKIAKAILESSEETKIDYLLFLSIMKVETTTFNQNAISSTGDVSIAQIKPEVWEKEFIRLKREPLDKVKLKKDATYAIKRMGEILDIIQNRHKKDPYWYARYHSGTLSLKMAYGAKVQQEYSSFREKHIQDLNDKVSAMLNEIHRFQSKTDGEIFMRAVNEEKIENLKKELTEYHHIMNKNKYRFAINN